jgi:hypothetical protein
MVPVPETLGKSCAERAAEVATVPDPPVVAEHPATATANAANPMIARTGEDVTAHSMPG